jgi:hypothetical protein
MEPMKKRNPLEKEKENELRAFMKKLGWHTEKTHGNLFQHGWPDLYCLHPTLAGGSPMQRWVEVKRGGQGRLESSQVHKFSLWKKFGLGVWVLTGPEDYGKLFLPPNWWEFLDPDIRRLR